MTHLDSLWKLEHLSDAQLLESLRGVLRTQRRTLANLVAHLGEVEERRLHLEAASPSMFAYCVSRLGMSEDEACRRIELARLARQFPALFAELTSGQITLSVALVLKPVLSPRNHLELLAAARGKCVRQARELVAERFPKPDVPSNIRKLPERPPMGTSEPSKAESLALSSPGRPPLRSLAAATLEKPPFAPSQPAAPLLIPALPIAPMAASSSASAVELQSSPLGSRPAATPASRSCAEPLSAQRYRIQFTADAGLKQKLELACDLLRHVYPNGDFAPIVSRALDLLITDLLRRRFGAGGKAARAASASVGHAQRGKVGTVSNNSTSTSAAHEPASGDCRAATATSPVPGPRSSRIPRGTRRAVLERDGLGCGWIDDRGVRCGSHGWLEFDHCQPAGKGGSSEAENLRLLCRAHNRLAAEHAYGRRHIERMSTRRREMDHPSPG